MVRPGTVENITVTKPSSTHPVMTALARGCPLTLLVDLADRQGPDSARILAREVADLSWLTGLRATATATAATSPARDVG